MAGFAEELNSLKLLRFSQSAIPVGGRLKFFWKTWRSIGASKRVCRWFRKGYALPFEGEGRELALSFCSLDSPSFLNTEYPGEDPRAAVLEDMLSELCEKKAIAPLPAGCMAFFNRVFLIPKKTGGFRLILDVSRLNSYLRVSSFRMDTVQVIRASVEAGMWAVSIDLSDAYHHIPIAARDQRFLAFQVGDRRFCYTVVPFGLSPAPQVFTEALTPLKIHSRKFFGLPVFQYLDDWLLLARSRERAAEISLQFTRACLTLGLLVNFEKSSLLPQQRLVHLGVQWDFEDASVRPPLSRVESLQAAIAPMIASGKGPLLLMESIRGQMVAMEKLVRHGRINFRCFQGLVTNFLKTSRRQRWVKLTERARGNLIWWSNTSSLLRSVPAIPPKPEVLVTTDASTQGWGAQTSSRSARGKWSASEQRFHINVLELLAVLKALALWGSVWQGKSVRFLMDNRTAVSYVSKQGGTRSKSSNIIAESIFLMADEFHLTLSAAYLPGEQNVLADMLSRSRQVLKNEWALSPSTFRWVCSRSPFGPPTVDLFANRWNHRLPRFFSPCPEPSAVGIDALSAPWPQETLFAFPPATILDRFLIKAQQERPQALLLVAPLHTVASWYPALRSHALWVLRFPRGTLELRQPHWEYSHPNPELLSLGVWAITWQDCGEQDIHRRS